MGHVRAGRTSTSPACTSPGQAPARSSARCARATASRSALSASQRPSRSRGCSWPPRPSGVSVSAKRMTAARGIGEPFGRGRRSDRDRCREDSRATRREGGAIRRSRNPDARREDRTGDAESDALSRDRRGRHGRGGHPLRLAGAVRRPHDGCRLDRIDARRVDGRGRRRPRVPSRPAPSSVCWPRGRLGRRHGRGLVVRHGPRVRITPARLAWVERHFARAGARTIIIGRSVGSFAPSRRSPPVRRACGTAGSWLRASSVPPRGRRSSSSSATRSRARSSARRTPLPSSVSRWEPSSRRGSSGTPSAVVVGAWAREPTEFTTELALPERRLAMHVRTQVERTPLSEPDATPSCRGEQTRQVGAGLASLRREPPEEVT